MVTDARCGPREIARERTREASAARLMVIGENLAMSSDPLATRQRGQRRL